MKLRHCTALLAASTASLVIAATPAQAQRVDRIVAFGDSYADDNNAVQLGLVPAPLLQLYPTGRFTGGTNYVDTLSQILGVPVFNYAIGGARANPDFLFEVSVFQSGGGGVFPTLAPVFDENDLLTVSIGGNDARAYGSLPGASVAGAPAAAAPAIAATQLGLNQLVAAGAPTISFLAGNTGELPEVAGNPAVAAIRSAYSNAFNQGVQQVLAGYAADGVMVHYLDLSLVLQRVQANLPAYGLTAVTCPAFPNPTCLLNSGAGFLIYGDLLHPTSQGSAIIARYVAAQLQAPLTLQAPTDLGLDTARQFGRTLSSRMEGGGSEQGIQFFVVGDMFSRDVEQDDRTDAFDIDSVGATVGVSVGFGNGNAGLAVNYSRPRARFATEVSETKTKSWQVGGFANYEMGGGFVQAYAGYGKDDHRIEREGVIDNMNASPDGSHWLAGAKGGFLVPMGGFRVGPAVSLEYAKAKVDRYVEEGDAALTLDVRSLSAKSLTGSIGLELRGDVDSGGVALKPFASAAIEKDFAGDGRTVRFSQTSAPVIVNSWELEDSSKKAYARLSGGASAAIFGGASLDASVSSTFGQDQGDEVSAHVGLSLGF